MYEGECQWKANSRYTGCIDDFLSFPYFDNTSTLDLSCASLVKQIFINNDFECSVLASFYEDKEHILTVFKGDSRDTMCKFKISSMSSFFSYHFLNFKFITCS